MLSSRSVLILFVIVSMTTILMLGFSDKLDKSTCKSVNTIDRCARTGGLNR